MRSSRMIQLGPNPMTSISLRIRREDTNYKEKTEATIGEMHSQPRKTQSHQNVEEIDSSVELPERV
jgi:hypothetical protein